VTRHFFFALCSLAAALSAADCGPTAPTATSGAAHDNAHLPPGDAAQGKALANRNSCTLCHGSNYAGSGFNPNLTPDPNVGLGSWTDAQVAAAIRDGMHDDGEALCGLMERFPFSDQEVANVIAFLRSLPPVASPATAVCPGHGG
jgi:mono/diheme cytochrome c family protein